MPTTYDGLPTSQLDGTALAHSNCTAGQASTLADSVSFRYWDPSPSAIRKQTGDTSGGMTYDAVVGAVKALTKGEVVLKAMYWAPADTLEDMIDDGRASGLSILCKVTVTTPWATGTYTGRHCIGVYGKRYKTLADGTKQKQGKVMDPGKSTAVFAWWPWSLIIKAALASTGGGGIHLMYTPDRTSVKRVARTSAAIRSSAKVIDSPSNKIGSMAEGAAVTVINGLVGGSYGINGHTSTGWAQIGSGKFVVGAKLKAA